MRTSPVTVGFVIAVILPSLSVSSLYAFSGPGHKTVAVIGEDLLTPEAKKAVKELIGSVSLEDISICADQIKHFGVNCGGVIKLPAMPQTSSWHYVDNAVKKSFTANSVDDQCGGKCVIDAVRNQAAILRDPSAAKHERQVALMFVVHLVGDLYQPMHAAEKNQDCGGNDDPFPSFNEPKDRTPMNLHHLWDLMVMTNTEGFAVDPKALAKKLEKGASSSGSFSFDSIPAAAVDSFNIAKKTIYPEYVKNKGKTPVDEYEKEMQPIVMERVQKAGVELADLLNYVLTNPSTGSAAAGAAASKETQSALRSASAGISKGLGSAASFDSSSR